MFIAFLALLSSFLQTPSVEPKLIHTPPIQIPTIATPSMPSSYFLDQSTVHQIICPVNVDGKIGAYTGSAFYVGHGKFVTARHVIRDEEQKTAPLRSGCMIAGYPITVIDMGKGAVDYAMIQTTIWLPFRAIFSCKGTQQGETYFATGYALSRPWQVTTRIIGSGSRSPFEGPGQNADVTRGRAVGGMSGGPVSDDDGVVVALVSAGDMDGVPELLVQSLSDTPLCKK